MAEQQAQSSGEPKSASEADGGGDGSGEEKKEDKSTRSRIPRAVFVVSAGSGGRVT